MTDTSSVVPYQYAPAASAPPQTPPSLPLAAPSSPNPSLPSQHAVMPFVPGQQHPGPGRSPNQQPSISLGGSTVRHGRLSSIPRWMRIVLIGLVVAATGVAAVAHLSSVGKGGTTIAPGSHQVTRASFHVATLWATSTNGHQVREAPEVANALIYVSTFTSVFALNALTGDIQWTASYGGIPNKLVIAGNVIYFNEGFGDFHVLNASTGAVLWTLPGAYFFAAAGSEVYVLGGNNELDVRSASTGALLRSINTGLNLLDTDAIEVANGMIYLGGSDGKLYALNASTGAFLWNASARASVVA